MSYLVARMQKMKTQNLGGIQKHNQREFNNNSNQDIDKDRSHLNYDLVNDGNIDYREKIMKTIESQKTSPRAVRKDAVLVNEWILTSDNEFFKEIGTEKTRDYFEKMGDFFKERYGEENVAYAQVHMDESTPHMHLGVVPMREGKLSSKNVFNRKELLAIQDELPRHMRLHGFNIQRGESDSNRKYLKVDEYKKMREQMSAMDERLNIKREQHFDYGQEVEGLEKKLEGMKAEEEQLELKLSHSKKNVLQEDKKGPFEFKRKGMMTDKESGKKIKGYFVTEEEAERLKNLSEDVPNVVAENRYLNNDNERVKKANTKLENENSSLKAENQGLKDSNKYVGRVMDVAQNHSKKISPPDSNGADVLSTAVTYAQAVIKVLDHSRYDKKIAEMHAKGAFEAVEESPTGIEDFEEWKKRRQKHLMYKRQMEQYDR